jgi:hypothetical protein
MLHFQRDIKAVHACMILGLTLTKIKLMDDLSMIYLLIEPIPDYRPVFIKAAITWQWI